MTTKQLDDIADWAKIKAYREAFPESSADSDNFILQNWARIRPTFSNAIDDLARRIARDNKPPATQELLIWREAFARYYDIGWPLFSKKYREGSLDKDLHEDSAISIAIKLALEGYGKEGAS